MKRYRLLPLLLLAASIVPPAPAARADEPANVVKIDVVTKQGNGYYHPDQIAVQRTLVPGSARPRVIRTTPVPAQQAGGMAPVPGTSRVYVTDRMNGSIWEMDVDTGTIIRQFYPSERPSRNLRGIAVRPDGNELYLYYNGTNIIQRVDQEGQVLETLSAPTAFGHSLTYRDGFLFLMDDRGHVYQVSLESKKVVESHLLAGPNGAPLNQMDNTFALAWDGRYWTVANARDGWKLYRYDSGWTYRDSIDLRQWNVSGLLYNGREYWVLNSDSGAIYTTQLVDGVTGDVGQETTGHYQYLGNPLTTTNAVRAFPRYPERNIALIYNDRKIERSFLRPYVAYLDQSGAPVGEMFDSFVFLPSTVDAARFFYKVTDQKAWTTYIKRTLDDLAALDAEWAETHQSLPVISQSARAKVYLAVPLPDPKTRSDLRKQAIHNYVDEAVYWIGSLNLSHIDFRGFYWYSEEAEYGEELVVDFNHHVHNKDLKTLWIPHHAVQIVPDHSVFGFDLVFQQPNYFFLDEGRAANLNRFYTLAQSGSRYHHGVLVELDGRAMRPEYRQRFQDYLSAGTALGYLGASKAWYDGGGGVPMIYRRDYPLYSLLHEVTQNRYKDPAVSVVTPTQGSLTSSLAVSVPSDAKVRIDLLTTVPFFMQRVILTLDLPGGRPVYYVGPLRADEELVVAGDRLVRQPIGRPAAGLRIGFNQSLSYPVEVIVMPKGADLSSLDGVGVECGRSFYDVIETDPTCSMVEYLVSRKVITGYPDGTFGAHRPVTRAEVAKMLVAAVGRAPEPGGTLAFADVEGHWAANRGYLKAAILLGAFHGFPDGTFRPDDQVTRAQVAQVAAATLGRIGTHRAPYSDVTIADWYATSVAAGYEAGLIGSEAPYPVWAETTFRGSQPATRGEFAMVLANLLQARAAH